MAKNIFETYFTRFKSYPQFITSPPNPGLFTIVVIPCYNEPAILETLISLNNCYCTKYPVEVIVVVNASVTTDNEIQQQNNATIKQIEEWKLSLPLNFQLHIIHTPLLPAKFAGAGLARKIGMDEAARRFAAINNPEGIIVSLDADTICEPNYLYEIENIFLKNNKLNGCCIYFEHLLHGNSFTTEQNKAIYTYELYLRYYINSLRFAQFPYAYHTVGSAFAVRVKNYMNQGGMNKMQAGEDFYFLHKIIPLGNFSDLVGTKIYPSSRVSDRVPFGTGVVIGKLLENKNFEYLTYRFDSFLILKDFFKQIDTFFKQKSDYGNINNEILKQFLTENNFAEAMVEINKNASTPDSFRKRFFYWFDAFRVIKFLNFVHETNFSKTPLLQNVKHLMDSLGIENIPENDYLEIFRKIDRKETDLIKNRQLFLNY